ncbi:MAG TPA: hypothetical protein QF353_07025 [Gammaproteobacteria bacterium]|nr:hypothetical protein [Gammaproteobacteria bacterium]
MYSVINIQGQDRLELLQGLITTDVHSKQHHKTCWCDAKGRVLADALMVYQPHALLALVHTTVANIVINHINHYKILADVHCSIEPYILSNNPINTHSITAKLLDNLSISLTPNPVTENRLDQHWQQKRYQHHYIHVEKATSGLFLPQSFGYDLHDMVNLHKGCYLGQEVLARLTRLGTLKRKLYQLSSNQAGIGSKIYCQEKEIGTLIDNTQQTSYAILSQPHQTKLTTSTGEEISSVQCLIP